MKSSLVEIRTICNSSHYGLVLPGSSNDFSRIGTKVKKVISVCNPSAEQDLTNDIKTSHKNT